MDGLTGFQRDILYTILGMESPHGLEIQERLDEYYSGRVTRTRVYSNLDILVERNFVEKGQKTERSNRYALTDHGIDTIVSHRLWEEQQLRDRLRSDSLGQRSTRVDTVSD
jgi:DNA-binding PadR family transcriptional regulator